MLSFRGNANGVRAKARPDDKLRVEPGSMRGGVSRNDVLIRRTSASAEIAARRR
jgi:hypothetical protein